MNLMLLGVFLLPYSTIWINTLKCNLQNSTTNSRKPDPYKYGSRGPAVLNEFMQSYGFVRGISLNGQLIMIRGFELLLA
jgi:hypothetical protein